MTRISKVRRVIIAREMDKIARRFEPRIARAFVQAVSAIRDQATLRAIADALAAGDLNRVMALAGQELGRALTGAGLPPGAPTVQEEIIGAFRAGGVMGMTQMPKQLAIRASLDLTNPEAVRFMRDYLPNLIREVGNEQMKVVQSLVQRGFTEGRPTVVTARDIRQHIGLTEHQSKYVANFRRQLETGEGLGYTNPWDRRLSGAERSMARAEFNAPISDPKRIDQLVDRYRDSLINRRAKDIARTETHRASIEGQSEVWRQAEERGILDKNRARRFWIVTPDDRARPDHLAVPKMNPDGVAVDEPFNTPVGPVMHPGDSGDPSFDINCRCAEGLEFVD